jgi:hypothetical protein
LDQSAKTVIFPLILPECPVQNFSPLKIRIFRRKSTGFELENIASVTFSRINIWRKSIRRFASRFEEMLTIISFLLGVSDADIL